MQRYRVYGNLASVFCTYFDFEKSNLTLKSCNALVDCWLLYVKIGHFFLILILLILHFNREGCFICAIFVICHFVTLSTPNISNQNVHLSPCHLVTSQYFALHGMIELWLQWRNAFVIYISLGINYYWNWIIL